MTSDHRYLIRLAHWLGAIVVAVLILSGLEIFRAFPSFGTKLPESSSVPVPPVIGLGGWLGGALAWHLLFALLFGIVAILAAVDLAGGGWRRVWLSRDELSGIWPMIRYYFLRGPKPEIRALYNPLQKLAYLSVYGFGALALLTGALLAQPVQLGWWLLSKTWAWQTVRFLHFAAMAGLVSFVPGHLLMVVISGKSTLLSMLTGEAVVRSPKKVVAD